MKIVILGTRGFPGVQGGVEAHCENLYPYLVKLGCEVFVFTRKPYVDISVREYKGVRLIPLYCFRNKYLEAFFHTLYGVMVAKKLKPDILHIHAIGPSLFIPLARLLRLKVVMTHHGPDYERKKWGKFAKIILKLGECLGCRWANEVIAISHTIAEGIKKKYHREAVVIPNGVVIPQLLKSTTTLERYGLKAGQYILSVGRLVPEKGFHDLIEAFNLLAVTNYKLVIVGSADHEDNYSRQLHKQAEKNINVVLTGFLSGIPLQELYSHAGLFVLPSYYEGLSIALLEAVSYGLACIVSDLSANREDEFLVENFFKAGDIKTLAEQIRYFINKPISNEGKIKKINITLKKYNWEKISENTLAFYNKVYEANSLGSIRQD